MFLAVLNVQLYSTVFLKVEIMLSELCFLTFVHEYTNAKIFSYKNNPNVDKAAKWQFP